VGAGDVNVFEHTLDPVIAKANGDGHDAHVPVLTPGTTGDTHSTSSPLPTGVKGVTASHDSHSPEVIAKERLLALLSVVLASIGIAIGWFAFRNNPLRKMPKILEQKWRLDEFYNGYIVDPITNLSREGLWKGFDLGFVDGIVNGIGHFVVEFGGVVRQLQVGFVRSYAAIILLGALAVIGYFIYYGFKLVA
jgi:NADH-quinone oxidoreductase subunit L